MSPPRRQVRMGSASGPMEARDGDRVFDDVRRHEVRHETNAALRARIRELEERARHRDRLAAIGRVAAGVAHDLNNMVTVIGLCAELLDAQAGLNETGREQLAHIRREAERGAATIWQILDFAHRGPITLAPVDVDTLLADLLPVLRRTQPARISVHLHTDEADHRILGDAVRLEQVVSNLATNASDAMPGGGRIDITLSRICSAGTGPGPWVRIAVADAGSGIPPEVLPHIFEPFFSTKPPGQGTGLGLAQVHGLVEQHGGNVRVDSVPGTGTTVEVWIPALA